MMFYRGGSKVQIVFVLKIEIVTLYKVLNSIYLKLPKKASNSLEKIRGIFFLGTNTIMSNV